jgi:ComF family protein
MAERESAKWIFPLYDYRHPPIKKALWLFKYKGKKRLASTFAEVIYDKILEELSELSVLENFHNAILIPIPLSPKRYRERGYNQAELICRELIKINNLRHLPAGALAKAGGVYMKLENNILIKPRETEHQARIENRAKRLKNIIGSFSIKSVQENTELIKGRNIILIDDITTTGATLSEARKILKQAGARKVIAFTVAH